MIDKNASTLTLKTIKEGEEWHEMMDDRPVAVITMRKVEAGDHSEPFVTVERTPVKDHSGTTIFKDHKKSKSVFAQYLSDIANASPWSEVRDALEKAVRSHMPRHCLRRDGEEPYRFTGTRLAYSHRPQPDGSYKKLSVYRTIGGTLIAHFSEERKFQVINGKAFIVDTAEELTKIVGYEEQAQEVMMKAGLYAGEHID